MPDGSAPAPYSHAGHMRAVLAASKAKDSKQMVLLWATHLAEFDRPLVSFTVSQMMERTGYNLKTVKRATAWLVAEGSLVPLDRRGGRGRPAFYRLAIVTDPDRDVRRGDASPDPDPEAGREARFRFLAQKHGAVRALELMRAEG